MSFEYLYEKTYDFTNKRRERTLENSDINNYNCGGAALMTYDAYIPYRDRESHLDGVQELWDEGLELSEIEEIILWRDVNQMLKEFGTQLRLVEENYQLAANERLIAYRIFVDVWEDCEVPEFDSDFHFKFKDYGQKKWFEKCGFGGTIHSCGKNNWENGVYYYGSDTIYFALTIK